MKPEITIGSKNKNVEVLDILNDGVVVSIGGREMKVTFSDCEALFKKKGE